MMRTFLAAAALAAAAALPAAADNCFITAVTIDGELYLAYVCLPTCDADPCETADELLGRLPRTCVHVSDRPSDVYAGPCRTPSPAEPPRR